MFESEKNLLVKLCQKSNSARQGALEAELTGRGVHFENWDDMALVVPSAAENVIVLCAHFDAVRNSFGYNDNGMALVTALKLLGELPPCIEFVFTNGEEHGAVGARYYLEHCAKDIRGCINLDVVGCFDQVYLDTMNCSAAASLTDCKQGEMPMNDACAFASEGDPLGLLFERSARDRFRRRHHGNLVHDSQSVQRQRFQHAQLRNDSKSLGRGEKSCKFVGCGVKSFQNTAVAIQIFQYFGAACRLTD